MKKIIETLMLGFLLLCPNQINAQDFESTLMSVKEYVKKLESFESEGGEIYCEKEGGKRYRYNNCDDFMVLRETGCFGNSTYQMKIEIRYTSTCEEIEAIKQARVVNTNYFILNSPDWWHSLPAEIIPMSGGIYSSESWFVEKTERDRLVSGKLLGDLKFVSQVLKNGNVVLVLKARKEDCGNVSDVLTFSPVLLADFDHDGIAELLIKGFRSEQSESCWLGSGNTLGAGFTVLLKKINPEERPIVLP